jgi:hypothetical protein
MRKRTNFNRRNGNPQTNGNRPTRFGLRPLQGSLPQFYTPRNDPPLIPNNYVITRRIRFTPGLNPTTGAFILRAADIAARIPLPNIASFNWHVIELRAGTLTNVRLAHVSGMSATDSGVPGARRARLALRAATLNTENYLPTSTEVLFQGAVLSTPSEPATVLIDMVVSVLTLTPALRVESVLPILTKQQSRSDFQMVSPQHFQ